MLMKTHISKPIRDLCEFIENNLDQFNMIDGELVYRPDPKFLTIRASYEFGGVVISNGEITDLTKHEAFFIGDLAAIIARKNYKDRLRGVSNIVNRLNK